MSSKFYIYARGCWREVELDTGCVSGWGRPNFVYLRGGRLIMAQRRKVLNALRLLAAGRASAAKDGCTLRKYIPRLATTLQRQIRSPVHHQQMIKSTTGQSCAQCNDVRCCEVLKETNTLATQCIISTADASNQVTESMIFPRPQNTRNDNIVLSNKTKSKKINESNKSAEHERKDKFETSAASVVNKKNVPKTFKKKVREQMITKETSQPSEQVKELLIEVEVVEILKRYLRKNNLGVDLKRFNTDDAYKESIFYRINPLVVVERCPRIRSMLNQRNRSTEDVALKEFVTSLGLQSSKERRPRGNTYKTRASTSQLTKSHSSNGLIRHNKENESIQNVARYMHTKTVHKTTVLNDYIRLNKKSSKSLRSPPAKRAKKLSPQPHGEVTVLSSSDSSSEHHEPPHHAAVRSSKPVAARPPPAAEAPSAPRHSTRWYSPMEDQAIISLVRQDERALHVNGNRLWRDLQHEHRARTGVARSWHSLRNRYLRYILPTLANIAPQPVAEHLRAAAATGGIKEHKRKKPANNSMLVLPRVRSAWAPHRARLLSSLSSASGSRTPMRSSTPLREERVTRLHDSKENKVSGRHSDLKRKYRDVETSAEEEAPRVLRPRPSEVSRRSRNPEDSESHDLRAAPKRRRLYNPQSAI